MIFHFPRYTNALYSFIFSFGSTTKKNIYCGVVQNFTPNAILKQNLWSVQSYIDTILLRIINYFMIEIPVV